MAKAHTLVDNFNDNALDPAKWYGAYGSPAPLSERIREVNGRIEIRPAPGVTAFNGLESAGYHDLTGSEVRVEVVRPLIASPKALTFLRVRKDSSNLVELAIIDGVVECGTVVAGQYTYFGERDYDPEKHRWLRLRELDGTTYWEVSAEGCEWTVVASKPNPFAMTVIDVELGCGVNAIVAAPGMAIFDNFNAPAATLSRRVEQRRLSARDVRTQAAELAARRPHDEHVNNNDEVNYATYTGRQLAGQYSKSLKHDSLGDPDPYSYDSLLRALQSEDPGDFDEIVLGSPTAVKLTNPQAGLAFDVAGPDAQEITQPPAPRFDNEVTSNEAGELYWMAVARDVWFGSYGTDPVITAAVASLNGEFPRYGGPRPVTTQNVFRGIFQGEQVGPYVSQFLWKGNTDQRKPDGQGRDANEGFVSYGAQTIDQRIVPQAAGVDYLTDFTTWLNVQNGTDTRGQDQFDTVRRFIRTLRDGATYVHFDQVLNAFYNAGWILMSEPMGNQLTFQAGVTGRPQIDLEFPRDQGNPYDPPGTAADSRTQVGFGTFGPIHLLQVLTEVLGRAIRAVWWQKWGVHRRLRPEEYGGRVRNQIAGVRTYPLHSSITTSLQSGGLAPYFGNAGERFPSSYLLPQAYAEGAPTHPAYGAGHATGGAACATMLKAFFDESKTIENPVIASQDGLSLLAYTGTDAAQMTVGGELNKLAGNISLFRNAAGVHWRSDHTESLLLGEQIAIRMLQEMSLTFNESDAFFELTRFDGQQIRIFDGKVVPVLV
jgi:hypothetical protein